MTTSNSPFSAAVIFVATGALQRVSKEFCRMKKVMICALLTMALVCCGTTVFAQMQEPGQGSGAQHRMPMSTDERLQHMTQLLNLTSDQQTKLRPILDNETQQMQALRTDTSMSRDDKMTRMRSIRQTTNSQINPILTSDQQQKWAQMQSQHMRPPAGAPPPAPPQQ